MALFFRISGTLISFSSIVECRLKQIYQITDQSVYESCYSKSQNHEEQNFSLGTFSSSFSSLFRSEIRDTSSKKFNKQFYFIIISKNLFWVTG